jgi:hypothetical protein
MNGEIWAMHAYACLNERAAQTPADVEAALIQASEWLAPGWD